MAPTGPLPQWATASSFLGFLDYTQRLTTVTRTPLEEWSARRRDLYLTTHNTHNRHPCPRWDSNPLSQQASGRRPTPETVQPLGPAIHLLPISNPRNYGNVQIRQSGVLHYFGSLIKTMLSFRPFVPARRQIQLFGFLQYLILTKYGRKYPKTSIYVQIAQFS